MRSGRQQDLERTSKFVGYVYIGFLVAAAVSDVLLLAAPLFQSHPTDPWGTVVGELLVAGFLNFLGFLFLYLMWTIHLPVWAVVSLQVALAIAVLSLIVWGLGRRWEVKMLIMVALTLPGVIYFVLFGRF